MQRVDALCGLFDLPTNNLRDKLCGKLRKGAAGSLALDNLRHLLANAADLGGSGVGGLLNLVGASLGEGNGEKAEEVVVGGFYGDVRLNQGLPFADQRAKLIGGEVQAVEVGQTVFPLNLVNP